MFDRKSRITAALAVILSFCSGKRTRMQAIAVTSFLLFAVIALITQDAEACHSRKFFFRHNCGGNVCQSGTQADAEVNTESSILDSVLFSAPAARNEIRNVAMQLGTVSSANASASNTTVSPGGVLVQPVTPVQPAPSAGVNGGGPAVQQNTEVQQQQSQTVHQKTTTTVTETEAEVPLQNLSAASTNVGTNVGTLSNQQLYSANTQYYVASGLPYYVYNVAPASTVKRGIFPIFGGRGTVTESHAKTVSRPTRFRDRRS